MAQSPDDFRVSQPRGALGEKKGDLFLELNEEGLRVRV